MSPIKVGFIGLSTKGWAADTLGPSLLQASLKDTYDLVAVSTTSEKTAKASADKYSKDVGHPIKAYYGDSAKIASDPDVDLVAVSVKAPYHKEVVLQAIEAKKDFFLEWPAGASLEDTKVIAEAAHNNNVRSLIGLQGRHTATTRKMKELLDSGIIGKVKSTNVLAHMGRELTYWPPTVSESNAYLLDKKNGVTRLTVPVGHQLDILTYLLGDFVNVTASDAILYPVGTFVDAEGKPTGKTVQSEIPDHISVSGQLKTGVFVNVFWRGGYISDSEKKKVGRRQFIWEIDGEEGTIRLESNQLGGAFPSIWEPEAIYLNGEKIELDAPGSAIQSTGTAWKDFAEGKEGYATIDDALKHRKLIDAIERSAREGRRILVEL